MKKPYLDTKRKRLLSLVNISTLCTTASIFCWRVLLLTVTSLLLTTAFRPILLTLYKGCNIPLDFPVEIVLPLLFCSDSLVVTLIKGWTDFSVDDCVTDDT